MKEIKGIQPRGEAEADGAGRVEASKEWGVALGGWGSKVAPRPPPPELLGAFCPSLSSVPCN